jgi:glycosyltransferase involved in cell wall biosynthesis
MEVSVLLTTYNQDKYLAQALDSVLMQETDFDYEMVILEDCSTDATREIVLTYQKRHPDKIRLRLAARNECSNKPFAEEFQAAPSLYIATLDGDDYWTSPKKLQKQVEFLKAHLECAMCFHNAVKVYEHGDRTPFLYNSRNRKPISALEDLWRNNFIASCTPMFRKSALREFPEWYHDRPYGDWPLYILCAQQGKIGYINEIFGVYRIHREGLWSKVDAIQKLESLIGFYETMNANLDFRFDSIVTPLISARREELDIMRLLVATVQRVLPPGAIVIMLGKAHEDLPPLAGHQVWPFPDRSEKKMQRQFASGSDGYAEAPWIEPNSTYEFRLFGGASQDQLLASVTVMQNATAPWTYPLRDERHKTGAFVKASPNPVPGGTNYGKTAINWSTGDGSKGVIYVAVQSLQIHYPDDGREAIEQFETFRKKGGEFLLVPRKLFAWLEGYAGLKEHLDGHYRLIQDDKICRIYNLCENAPETSGAPTGARNLEAK